jgi:hypothetical protein
MKLTAILFFILLLISKNTFCSDTLYLRPILATGAGAGLLKTESEAKEEIQGFAKLDAGIILQYFNKRIVQIPSASLIMISQETKPSTQYKLDKNGRCHSSNGQYANTNLCHSNGSMTGYVTLNSDVGYGFSTNKDNTIGLSVSFLPTMNWNTEMYAYYGYFSDTYPIAAFVKGNNKCVMFSVGLTRLRI